MDAGAVTWTWSGWVYNEARSKIQNAAQAEAWGTDSKSSGWDTAERGAQKVTWGDSSWGGTSTWGDGWGTSNNEERREVHDRTQNGEWRVSRRKKNLTWAQIATGALR